MTRKEAIKELELYRGTTAVIEISEEAYNMAIDALKEQKEGHWIVKEDNTSFVKQIPRRWVECSVCRWSFSYDRIHDKYCSKCGAKMKSEDKK